MFSKHALSKARADRENEFDPQPYFSRWIPSNYNLGSDRNYELAQELYDPMTTEFSGWIALYRTALDSAAQLDGALEACVRCCMKIVELGLEAYLEWFDAPQAEFGNRSPRQWFDEHGLNRLKTMLAGYQ